MATKMQDFLDEVSPNDRRGLFQNPPSNFDGWRLFMGDLDTTRTRPKPAHMLCRQLYSNIPSIIPSLYANPDSMDAPGAADLVSRHRLDGDLGRGADRRAEARRA